MIDLYKKCRYWDVSRGSWVWTWPSASHVPKSQWMLVMFQSFTTHCKLFEICHCSGMKRSSQFLMDTVKSNLHFLFIAHTSLHRNTSYCGRKMGCERMDLNDILISYPSSFVKVTSPDEIGCFFKCGHSFWT